MNKDLYDINSLSLGMVEYIDRNRAVTDIHVLLDTGFDEEKFDLNLYKPINTYSNEEIFFPKTIIPFEQLLMSSRINWTAVSRENALVMGAYLNDKYLKFLRSKRVTLKKKN